MLNMKDTIEMDYRGQGNIVVLVSKITVWFTNQVIVCHPRKEYGKKMCSHNHFFTTVSDGADNFWRKIILVLCVEL